LTVQQPFYRYPPTPAGLFNMLSDSSHEIRQQADAALSEFLQEIKNSPVRLLS